MDCPARRATKVIAAAISLFLGAALFAEPVDLSQARKAVDTFLKIRASQSDKARGTVSVTSEASLSVAGLVVAGVREILSLIHI